MGCDKTESGNGMGYGDGGGMRWDGMHSGGSNSFRKIVFI